MSKESSLNIPNFKNVTTIRGFTKTFALPEWRWYLLGVVFLAATNYISLEIPQLAKKIVNALEAAKLSDLESLALMIIGLGFLQIFVRALSRVFVFWPGRKLEAVSKTSMFNHLLRLPQSFFASQSMGDLISRITNDITHIRVFYGFAALQVINLSFLVALTVAKMTETNAKLTIAALAPLALMVVIIRYTMPKMHRFSLANQKAVGDLTSATTEAFVQIPVIQANAASETFAEKIGVQNEEVYLSNMRLLVIRQILFPMMGLLSQLSQVVILFYGGYEVIRGALSVGDILAFNVYIGYLAFPLSSIGIVISIYQRAQTALHRLEPMEQAEPEENTLELSKSNNSQLATLSVQGLSFSYETSKEEQKFTLQDISLTLPPGKKIGLFGPVGSGKTTLLNLLARILPPKCGDVFLGSTDITHINIDTLRSKVGYALQEAYLFSDTIEANLAFGIDPPPPREDLINAARQAEVLNDIDSFENGWQTQVGEKGVRLSGGQKQRLALARVFLRKPEIYLLDDILSAVDHTTETRLVDNINALNVSAVIASHRVSVLKACDEILIFDQGRIVDRGPYTEVSLRHPDLREGE